ncbi:MAG TPA: hypothetical protein VGB63_11805 [Pedobacter sp.]
MKTFSIFVLLFILIGCGSKVQSDRAADTDAIDTFAADGTITNTSNVVDTALPKKDIKTFNGLYISGNEVSTFRTCENHDKVYWLEDESKKVASSYKKAQGFLPYPYESIYLEVKGYLRGKSNVGYAGEYENVLVVTDIISAVQKSFSTDCFVYEFVALGNEPFWSLDIIPSEKIIALKDVAADKTYVFHYKPAKTTENSFTYDLSNDKKETMKVVITRETCSDGMSDREYNYSAQVNINRKLLKGCAIKKGNNAATNQ